jgi:hypothetical protein
MNSPRIVSVQGQSLGPATRDEVDDVVAAHTVDA